MIEAISILDSQSQKIAIAPTGVLNDHVIKVINLEEKTEALFNALQEMNEPIFREIDFTATLLNESELLILQEIIQNLNVALESIRPENLTTEEFVDLKIGNSNDAFFPFGQHVKKNASKDWSKPLSSTELAGEILEQRSRFSKMIRTKESAPFFFVAKKNEKKETDVCLKIKESYEKDIEKERTKEDKTNMHLSPLAPYHFLDQPRHLSFEEKRDSQEDQNNQNREQEQKKDQEQQQNDEGKQRFKEQEKLKIASGKKKAIDGIYATTMSSTTTSSSPLPNGIEGINDVFHSFMILMERILGQAQAEAHQLYQKIKARTDQVELLTKILGKLNLIDGKVDWSKDEEMKAMIQQARAIGVEIPENKYVWTKDEKRSLVENIQMRKDTMEKMTQLERTDMQRYMQEAAHCHQARSNILKLMKEIGDTIIANLRP